MTVSSDHPYTFSMVICTFNRADQLGDALNTALFQETDADAFRYEVIVVDNNSTDSTRSLIESFLEAGHTNLRHFFEGRQGRSYALNTALAAVRGEYYTIVDDDFLLPRDWLQKIHEGIRRRSDASYFAGKVLPKWSAAPPDWLTQEHWSAIAMADFGETEFESSSHNRVCLLACTFRTADVKALGGYDARLGVRGRSIGGAEDFEIHTRLWSNGKKGVYLPHVHFFHRVEAERLSKRYHRRWHRGHGRTYAIMRDLETEGTGSRLLDVPLYMYRELIEGLVKLAHLSVARRSAAAFTAETRLWFIVGFLRERLRQRLCWPRQRANASHVAR